MGDRRRRQRGARRAVCGYSQCPVFRADGYIHDFNGRVAAARRNTRQNRIPADFKTVLEQQRRNGRRGNFEECTKNRGNDLEKGVVLIWTENSG